MLRSVTWSRATPGPRGLPLLGVLPTLNRDPLGFFVRCARDYGAIAHFHVLHYPVFLLSHPADIETVLAFRRDDYRKSVELRALRPIFGNGLLVSEGEFWRRQRRRLQPAFHPDRLTEYASWMIHCAEQSMHAWQVGEEREIHRDMMDITRRVVCEALFGAQPGEESNSLVQAVRSVFSDLPAEALYLPFLQKLPMPRHRRWQHAVKQLDQLIDRFLADRRAATEEGHDLLGMLLQARDENGSTMSDPQVRDEIMTLFLAGHETAALSLTWALYLLATHPEIQHRVAREVRQLSAGGPLRAADLPHLRLTALVIKESLRLYPPVWALSREAVRDTQIGTVAVPAGAQVWMCTWNVHRSPSWYEDPDRFRPERWEESRADRPRFTYFPFGGGARICLGQGFAMTEATLVLASLLRRFRFSLAPGAKVELAPWITLRPKDGVRLVVHGVEPG